MRVLTRILRKDPSGHLAHLFLKSWEEKDNFNHLFDLLLDCPDQLARTMTSLFLKYVIVTLRDSEKSILSETENHSDSEGQPKTVFKALSARFMEKAIKELNFKVAKNWVRFEQFLDVINYFAEGSLEDVESSLFKEELLKEMSPLPESSKTVSSEGLEFLFKQKMI